MHDLESSDELAEKINQLYWESESTVDSISKELELSRNALYAAILPVPTGSTCLECGSDTVFVNRTGRAGGMAVCRSCEENGRPVAGDAARVSSAPGAGRRREATSDDGYGDDSELERWSRWREDLLSVPPQRAAMIGGAAALGLVMGAAAVRVIRSGS
jgi:hypothetical protein